jgi:hypothetical protein
VDNSAWVKTLKADLPRLDGQDGVEGLHIHRHVSFFFNAFILWNNEAVVHYM